METEKRSGPSQKKGEREIKDFEFMAKERTKNQGKQKFH